MLARTQVVDGAALHVAIAAERLHRGLPPAETFTVPPTWASAYPRMADKTPHCDGLHETDAAASFVAGFLEPAMTGAAGTHRWSPTDRAWQPY